MPPCFLPKAPPISRLAVEIQSCEKSKKATSGIAPSRGFAYAIKVHIGVDLDSCPIHSIATTSAIEHDISRADQLLHCDEDVAFCYGGYQGF